jgi:hypothetical protein
MENFEDDNDEDEFFLISSSSHSVNSKMVDDQSEESGGKINEQEPHYVLNPNEMSQQQQYQQQLSNRLSNITEEDDIDEADDHAITDRLYSNNMLLDELIQRLNIEQQAKFETKNYLLDDENVQIYESLREFNDRIPSENEESNNENDEIIEKGFFFKSLHKCK